MYIQRIVSEAHLIVQGERLLGLILRRISLNELVVEEDTWVWNLVEQVACIGNVGNLKKLQYKVSVMVCETIFNGVSWYLLQLVHEINKLYPLGH